MQDFFHQPYCRGEGNIGCDGIDSDAFFTPFRQNCTERHLCRKDIAKCLCVGGGADVDIHQKGGKLHFESNRWIYRPVHCFGHGKIKFQVSSSSGSIASLDILGRRFRHRNLHPALLCLHHLEITIWIT